MHRVTHLIITTATWGDIVMPINKWKNCSLEVKNRREKQKRKSEKMIWTYGQRPRKTEIKNFGYFFKAIHSSKNSKMNVPLPNGS